jgi:hypothetical protein
MKDVLDNISEDLDTTETRILLEFKRLQETADDSGIGKLTPEFREEMRYMVIGLQEALDSSGSVENLQLTSERHEDIRARLFVINQLIDRQIPLTAFSKADSQLKKMGKPISSQRVIVEKKASAVITKSESGSLLDKILAFFGLGNKPAESSASTHVEKEPTGPKEIYKDTGIYGATQHLAMLAQVVADLPPPEKEDKPRQAVTGKASFEARDLSSTISDIPAKAKTVERIAQTPEEIRRKLEARKKLAAASGKAVFGAEDVKAESESIAKQAISQTPRKMTIADAQAQTGKGKAKFVSRDIQGIATDPTKLKEKLADLHKKDDKQEP